MACTLDELARLVGGTVVGDGTLTINGASPPATAAAGELTLVDKPENLKKLTGCPAAAAVVPPGVDSPIPAIVAADVHAAFSKIVMHFRPQRAAVRIGVSPLAVVSPSARLGANVDVHPHAVIGDDVEIGANATIHAGVQIMAGSKLGDDVVVFPNSVLYENTIVGARSILHAAVVLGAYGFGYKQVAGRHVITAQLGWVELGDDVEIGAGTTIDRGTYGPTRIGEGTKIDDQVQIGHNVLIGKHNLICAQVGIAGSSSTGDYVVIAGQAGFKDHVHIGHRAVIGGMSGIMNDIPEGAVVVGLPATPAREQMVKQASLNKLPEMLRQFKALEKTVAELQRRLATGEPDSAAA
jgi:UDP-3-O-[3-hydroxymyristoyl] glucosamine N-acyltransferase